MSGVSISEGGNLDLNAIVAGGDAFLARIKEFGAAKAQAEAALDSYNIGRDVVAKMRDVQAHEQAALNALSDAKAEAEKLIADATAQAETITTQAQAGATAMLAKARSDADALDAQVKNAWTMMNDWSAKTQAEAASILEQANAAKGEADKQLVYNQQAAKDLDAARAETQAATNAANATQDALNAKLEAIRAAAS